MLTARASGLQERLISTWQQMFEKAIAAGEIKPEMDAQSLALYIVRIGESAIYCDLICGRKPEPGPATTAFRLLVNGHQR